MTTPTPLPIDVSPITEPLPDPAHEAIRAAVLTAIQAVFINHQSLLADLAEAKADLEATQQTVTDLQAAVAALTPATPTV